MRRYGPFKNTLDVRSAANGTAIEIFGSINKFGNGHNLAGSEDLRLLASYAYKKALANPKIGVPLDVKTCRRLAAGDIQVLRVDLATHAIFLNERQLEHAQRALKLWMAFQARNFSSYKHETLYLGWQSKISQFKSYIKHLEMKKHPPKSPNRAALLQYAKRMLRFELSLLDDWFRLERRRHLSMVNAWTLDTCRDLLRQRIDALDLCTVDMRPLAIHVPELKTMDRLIFRLYESGEQIESLADERWFQEHRSIIKKATGVDIAIPFAVRERASDFFDLAELRGLVGYGQPQWALKEGLIAMPVTEEGWLEAA